MAITNDILDQLIGNAKSEEDLFGKDAILKDLSKQLVERMLDTEMTHHLGYEKHAAEGRKSANSRNGKTSKTIKTMTFLQVYRKITEIVKTSFNTYKSD